MSPFQLAQRLNRDHRVSVTKTLVRSLIRRAREKLDDPGLSSMGAIRFASNRGWMG